MRSYFSRVARYVPSEDRNPREDMLTEAFAATLEHSPELAKAIASAWLRAFDPALTEQMAASGSPKIRTQYQPHRSRDRIDLTLSFPDADGGEWLFWVEVKRNARLSGDDQLQKYRRQLDELPQPAEDRRHLVFLPPAGYELDGHLNAPEGLVESSWQAVGEVISECYPELPDPAGESETVSTWVVRQFRDHLREEGLFVSEPLKQKDMECLEGADHARTTLGVLVDRAANEIDQWVVDSDPALPGGDAVDGRGRKPQRAGASVWPEFYRHYGKVRGAGEDVWVWLEWNLRVPTTSPYERPKFGAGLTVSGDIDAGIWERLVAAGLEDVDDHGFRRAFKYLPVSAILAEPTLGDQRARLVKFVEDAFTAVSEVAGAITAMSVAARLTAEEFLAPPGREGAARRELINGEVVENDRDDQALPQLAVALAGWSEAAGILGQVSASLDVRLDNRNVYSPVAAWYTASRAPDSGADPPATVPALAVEVRSRSTWRYNLGAKKTAYERHGLPELWLVDTASATVLVFRRSAPTAPVFDVALEVGRGDVLGSPALPGFELAVARLFEVD